MAPSVLPAPTSTCSSSMNRMISPAAASISFRIALAISFLCSVSVAGADSTQATSGLTILCLAMGLGCVVFSLRTRMPITMAWSTPGAALLAATAIPAGGWPAAVGAFVVTGLLLALLARFIAGFGARRRRRQVAREMHGAIGEVAQTRVLDPVNEVLDRHRRTRELLHSALG